MVIELFIKSEFKNLLVINAFLQFVAKMRNLTFNLLFVTDADEVYTYLQIIKE